MKRKFLLVAVVLATALGVTVSPAGATTEVASDTRGDVWLSRVDIVGQGAGYGSSIFTLAVGTARPVDPSIWPNSTGIIWGLDTNSDGIEDYEAYLLMNTASLDDSSGNEVCRGSVSYDGTLVFASFAASCIGNAGSFRLASTFMTDTAYSDAWDFGPACCLVFREGSAPPPPPPPPPTVTSNPDFGTADANGGYWMLAQDGSVWGFGGAPNLPATGVAGAVHIEPTPSGKGYWVLYESGGVIYRGDAAIQGDTGSAGKALRPGEKAVSLSATPSGGGYWIFTDKGAALPFGDAQSFGDMSGYTLNGAVVGSIATPSGQGYWMVGSDGGIFSFGDAKFHGSTGNVKLNKPVMAMSPSPDGSGYWLVASDGGIFAFNVPFYGSMGSTPLNKPISGMVPGNGGYMMVGQDGGIFSFGNVAFHGSLGANPPKSPVISVALRP